MHRYALITGASSGLGRELSISLASRGFHIIMISRNATALQELKDHLSGLGYNSTIATADLSDIDQTINVINDILNSYSEIEIIINNAGSGVYGPIIEYDDKLITSIINLNLVSPILISKYGLNYMINNNIKGTIVNISSLIVYTPIPWFSIYTATKSALKSFTDSLRMEAKPYGVRILGVYPGYIDTPFHRNVIRTKTTEKIQNRGIPTNPLIPRHTPKIVAKYIVEKIMNSGFNGDIVIGYRYKLLKTIAQLFPSLIKKSIEKRFIKTLKSIEKT